MAEEDPTGMCAQIDELFEQGIAACPSIGPRCLTLEIVEELMEVDPNEAWYITDEPVGVIVPCPK